MGLTTEVYCSITLSKLRPQLYHIPFNPTNNPNIIIRIHKEFDIHQIPQALVFQNQNPFDDKDILRLLMISLITASMLGVVINRDIHRTTSQELTQMINHQVGIKGQRVVIVGPHALFKGQMRLIL